MLRSASRGILTLVLVGALTGALIASPVSARRDDAVTKRFVRNLVNTRVSTLRADLASQLREQRSSTYSSSIVGPVALNSGGTDKVVLSLPVASAGTYVVAAKLWWNPIASSSTGVGGEIDCDLLAEQAFDTSREAGNSDFDYGTLSLQLTDVLPGTGNVTLRCRDEFSGGNPVEIHNVVVTAIRVAELTSTPARPVSGGPASPSSLPDAPQRP